MCIRDRYQSLFDRAEGLGVQANAAVAFVVPELLTMTREQVKEYEETEPELAVYAHYFDELFRQKEHILSAVSYTHLDVYKRQLSA